MQTAHEHTPEITPDWQRVAYTLLLSRALDDFEEYDLVKRKKVLYQFSARGHDLAQILLGQRLTDPKDAVSGYYRSRPLLLSLGLPVKQALQATMMKEGGFSDGRDIGVVFNWPGGTDHATVLPMSGGVGAQYTPVAGWAQAVEYHANHLKNPDWKNAIGVVLGGDGSVAANGFWSALTLATTQDLPMGTKPAEAAELIEKATDFVRQQRKPALLRLTVPRLNGHSAQDTQTYKTPDRIAFEKRHDPLPKLKKYLLGNGLMSEKKWYQLARQANEAVQQAFAEVDAQPRPDTRDVTRFVFEEKDPEGQPVLQQQGGIHLDKPRFPPASREAVAEPGRVNMVTAIRRVLDFELQHNRKMLVFGEDVGAKGGVHAVTLGLQEKHGSDRVFDTSLSEEGIIGRSLGMALAGLLPVPEIQFRKYADPAEEQLNDIGTFIAGTRGTANAPRSNGCMPSAGRWPCPPMPKTPQACCDLPCAITTRLLLARAAKSPKVTG